MGAREHDALALAVNGFEVFPVKPGEKSPPFVKFSLEATGDPEAVAELWQKHPAANIGLRTNGGTLVLDRDTKEAARFVAELDLPPTTSTRTPRGGGHDYLIDPTSRARCRTAIRPGLDVRGRTAMCWPPEA